MGRSSKRRKLHYHEERPDNADESNYGDGEVGERLYTHEREGNSYHPKGKKMQGIGSGCAVEILGSGSKLRDVERGAACNGDEGGGEIEDEDDEDEDGENEDGEDEDDEEEQSDSDSYISDPTSGADEEAVYDRYLQRKAYLQRKEDRYLAEAKMKEEEFERGKETDVQQAHQTLEAALVVGKSVPIGPIDGGRWELYSAEYFSHYFVLEQPTKVLSFQKNGNYDEDMPDFICGPGQASGELHIYPEGHLDIYPFTLPTQASLEPVVVRAAGLDQDLEIIFLGDGYLKLKVELDILIKGKSAPHAICEPKVIEFFGIWISDEEQRRRLEESFRTHRPSSPKNSMAAQMCGWDMW
jgi:hypothetical protein